MEKHIIPNGVPVIFGYSSFGRKGTVIAYKENPEAYYILTDDGKGELASPDQVRVCPPIPPGENYVAKAYKIWIAGMILSLIGIFVGQWMGEYYKNPIVYYVVSGIWAAIMGGTSAAIGFIYIAKSKF